MQLLSLMDWSWFFFSSHCSIGVGLTSEPVTTDLYSGRRVATELSAGLRVRLRSSPSSCSPRQADWGRKPNFALRKTGATSESHLDWRLLNTSVNQVNCPHVSFWAMLNWPLLQSVQWQQPWVRERNALFLLPSWHKVPKQGTRIGFRSTQSLSALQELWGWTTKFRVES